MLPHPLEYSSLRSAPPCPVREYHNLTDALFLQHHSMSFPPSSCGTAAKLTSASFTSGIHAQTRTLSPPRIMAHGYKGLQCHDRVEELLLCSSRVPSALNAIRYISRGGILHPRRPIFQKLSVSCRLHCQKVNGK